MVHTKHFVFTYSRILALGFLGVILLGTLFLCLPISSRSGKWSPFVNCLFTATSATCVTGLAVYDTCMYWSVFGQVVILLLIQVGGLGFMTVITMFSYFLGKHQFSLREKHLLMQSAGGTEIGGIQHLFHRVLLCTLVFEGAGIVILAFKFCPSLGLKGLWFAVFHSVSAFCNAGFDLMGGIGELSFVGRSGDIVINLTLIVLIVTGGIGFLVLSDLLHKKFRFSAYRLQTKIVLTATATLIVAGTVLYYIFEQNSTLAGMSEGKQWLVSLFQSVTARTAGFASADLSRLSDSGSILMMLLMFIGGSPGSCAGGIKTTTVAVLLLCIFTYAKTPSTVCAFKKKISNDTVQQAFVIACIYLCGVIAAVLIIGAIEPFGLKQILFETISAVSTTGLTMGITTELGVVSRLVLTLLMYAGRIGGLSLLLAISAKKNTVPLERPTEKILVG